ncbi:MAG: TetR family transcriptional regulator [Rhodospirillaceae bacterium]|nr:TetR family transcriptional regulator [Rhodospirillaceae bacterium]MBT6202937.1 TetR family transcriptional regulator [Rhodospirillaceae bacterium]MBT6509268.1 TetR family transcriptional regulator [Rhodospirillaceae bacterium]MBT7611891.1 TetR family transcriptional regulator [Rhodospirillaceae bacterium]MBT7648402.1 TetR family transcriptional regulator [Rhodospirillaceae bacterium]
MPKVVDHDERRDALAQAAWRVIGRDGLDGATLREIAHEAGCSTGVIQHYFLDRDDLLAFAASQISERASRGIAAAEAKLAPGLPRLRALMMILVPDDLQAARVSALLSFWARSAIDPVHNAIHRQQFDALHRTIRLEVVVAQAAGQIDARREAQDIADSLIAFGDGLCVRSCLHPDHFSKERRDQLIDGMLLSLTPQKRMNP